MNAKEYVRTVLRHTRVSRKNKRRLREDLTQDIEARLASGQTMAQVIQEMGEPATVAARIQGSCELIRPYTWPERVLLFISVIFGLLTVLQLLGICGLLLGIPTAGALDIIGGADGPTAVIITSVISPISYLFWGLAAICLVALILLRRRK